MSVAGQDLNLLVALRALLEEANVTKAGERLDMSQSAMSSALSRLRVQFEDELLVRVGREYELTPLGHLLLPQLQRTLPLVDKALKVDETFDPYAKPRTFRIQTSDYSAIVLHYALAALFALKTKIKIELVPLPQNAYDRVRDLWNNDFIMGVPGMGITGQSQELFTDHYVVLVDKNNPRLKKGKLDWTAFTELPHVVYDFGRGQLTPVNRKLFELGFTRKAHVSTSSMIPIPSILAGTDMIAVVPSRLSEKLPVDSPVIAVPAPFGKVEVHQVLWWHESHNYDPGHVWLREFLLVHDYTRDYSL
ncbi:MAG: LysR family transcriptional regulator [Micrococcales bacterium]